MEISVEITTLDLSIIRELIESSARNGLIEPRLLSTVGSLYEKIDNVLSNIDSLDKA